MTRPPSIVVTQDPSDARFHIRVTTQKFDVDDPTLDYHETGPSGDRLLDDAAKYFEAIAQKLRDMRDRKGAVM